MNSTPTPPTTPPAAASEPRSREVREPDERSALVKREFSRVDRHRGIYAEQTMEGSPVRATWLDDGILRRVKGIVRRNDAGELVVRSADGNETPVPRDASVNRGRVR